MKKGLWITIGLVGAGLTIYGSYLYNQFMKLYKGEIKVKGIKNLVISGTKVAFDLLITINNGGDLSAKVKEQDYEVLINGKSISKIKSAKKIIIASNGISTIPFSIEVDLSKLSQFGTMDVANLLFDKSKIKIDLKGSLTVRAGIFKKTIPLELTYSLQEIMDMAKSTPTTA